MGNDWQIFVEYRPANMRTFIYVARRTSYGIREYLVKGGTEVLTQKEGEAVKDDEIYFLAVEDEYILSLLVQALDKRGIKAPSQSYIEGKHEATQAHLNDLRELIPKLSQRLSKTGATDG